MGIGDGLMSRSYKKHPVLKGGRWLSKRNANHKYRMYLKKLDDEGGLPLNLSKRITDSYDICDIRMRETREEAIHFWNEHKEETWLIKRYPTLESYLKDWEKWYKRK